MSSMDRNQLREGITSAMASVLGRPGLELTDATRASDVPGWDSLNHLKLLVALEEKYNIRFEDFDLQDPRNFGEFLNLVQSRISP
jgi:acyl carrier protein